MLPQILPKKQVSAFVESLMKQGNRLVAPVAKGGQFAFAEIDAAGDIGKIRLDYDATILPPKKFLLPQCEELLEFGSSAAASAKPVVGGDKTVIFAVHPYDLHAIGTLDAAMSQAPADANYQARRAATRIVGMNIRQYADEHQFMADMDTVGAPEGVCDLFMTDLGDRYFVEVCTAAGAAMTKAGGIFRAAGPEDHKAKQQFDAAKAANFTKRLPYNVRYLPDMLDASYDSLLWDAVARKCFSCGTCTNVCPTCYCFDVQDKLNLDVSSGQRQRRWDSCQLKVFAEVAGGENFREHRSSRLRHRMFRKGKYIAARTGKPGCVGCGRCGRQCVAGISILEAFQQIAGEAAELEA